jgi:predicted RNase H-like HicB family nuclease
VADSLRCYSPLKKEDFLLTNLILNRKIRFPVKVDFSAGPPILYIKKGGRQMARKMQRVELTLHLPIRITKKQKWTIASCPILDVHAQGETEKKAKNNLVEALYLFFTSCFERGTLDTVLKECGFNPVHVPSKRRRGPEEEYIDVPIPFDVRRTSQTNCHV